MKNGMIDNNICQILLQSSLQVYSSILAHAGTAGPIAMTAASKTDVKLFLLDIFMIPLSCIIVYPFGAKT